MTAALMDFSVNKENKTINIKKEYAAELPLVWDAYTRSEILDQWWAPHPWKSRTKAMDFKEGGQWLYAMVGPKGEEHWSIMNYASIQSWKKFTGDDAFTDANGTINKEMPQSKWEVTFTAKGDKTLVEFTITYPELSDLEETIKMGFREGISMAAGNLDELLPKLKK